MDKPFQYMLLLRGATRGRCRCMYRRMRFNTCSSCEEQLRAIALEWCYAMFQYMLLLRGATNLIDAVPPDENVSIHAPLARSNFRGLREPRFGQVSIHAPLARSNIFRKVPAFIMRCFNTCSSCEEQHTLRCPGSLPSDRFNTCSSCEEQLDRLKLTAEARLVSIHAPLARSNKVVAKFADRVTVSIHAPLARSNLADTGPALESPCFNTCSSCEEQRPRASVPRRFGRFNTCSSCEEQLRAGRIRPLGCRFNTCSSCEEQPSS